MPMEKLTMRKIKDVLKLHYGQKFSNREIARSLGISAGTVANYLVRAKAAQIPWPLSDEWDEDKLYQSLFPPTSQTNGAQRPLPDMVQINQELKRKGVVIPPFLTAAKSRDLGS